VCERESVIVSSKTERERACASEREEEKRLRTQEQCVCCVGACGRGG